MIPNTEFTTAHFVILKVIKNKLKKGYKEFSQHKLAI